MDAVRLLGVRLVARLGVSAEERAQPQPVELDIEMRLGVRAAGEGDDLGRTVDYGAVFAAVQAAVEGKEFRLLEAVAERAAAASLVPGVEEVVVRVRKFRPPVAGHVAASEVEVRRRPPPGPAEAP